MPKKKNIEEVPVLEEKKGSYVYLDRGTLDWLEEVIASGVLPDDGLPRRNRPDYMRLLMAAGYTLLTGGEVKPIPEPSVQAKLSAAKFGPGKG